MASNQRNTFHTLVSSDRPIDSRSEDRLRRLRFSDQLAGLIHSWKGKESLVISLCGQWGTGKTSIINLVKETLSKQEPRLTTLDFNPWQWTNADELVRAFFHEVNKTLGNRDNKDHWKKVSRKFKSYSSFFGVAQIPFVGLPKLLTIVVAIPVVSGLGLTRLAYW